LALDIICRIYHYHSKIDPKVISQLLQTLPAVIERALVDTNIGANQILRNMRPLLAEVNEKNANIDSLPLKAFFIQKRWDIEVSDNRYLQTSNWIDIELEKISYSIYDAEEALVTIKLKYQSIRRIHFATATNTAQVS